MPKILLKSLEPRITVFVDARYSNCFVPFNDLPSVPGFPREMTPTDVIEIDMTGWSELLLRHNVPRAPHLPVSKMLRSDLYRIAVPEGKEIVRGSVWEELPGPQPADDNA